MLVLCCGIYGQPTYYIDEIDIGYLDEKLKTSEKFTYYSFFNFGLKMSSFANLQVFYITLF